METVIIEFRKHISTGECFALLPENMFYSLRWGLSKISDIDIIISNSEPESEINSKEFSDLKESMYIK